VSSVDKQLGERLRQLKKEDPQKLQEILEQLSDNEARQILYDPEIWLRENQKVQDWWPEPIIMFMAGRGFGKSLCGAQWLRKQIRKGLTGQATIIAPTSSDLRDTIVYNTIIPWSDPEEDNVQYEPSKSRIVFYGHNDTAVNLISSERGEERIRGKNNEVIWVDELGSIPEKDVMDQALLTLRIGQSKCVITTTPRPTPAIIDLYHRSVFNDDPPKEGKDCRIITGKTEDNFDNLSEAFKSTIINAYEGTRLAEQELQGKLLLDAEGALWSSELIINQTLKRNENVPDMDRYAIGIDPAVTNTKRSDSTGIIISGLGVDGYGYVIEDLTGKYSSDGWVQKVLQRYDHYSQFAPTSIVVESNNGGRLLAQSLQRNRPLLPIDETFSSSSKIARAQPISMLYEQGKIFHAHSFPDLEREYTSYDGSPRQPSPDHMDAAVFSLTQLMPVHKNYAKVSALEI